MTYIKKNGDIDWDAYNDDHRIVDGVHVPNCVGFPEDAGSGHISRMDDKTSWIDKLKKCLKGLFH